MTTFYLPKSRGRTSGILVLTLGILLVGLGIGAAVAIGDQPRSAITRPADGLPLACSLRHALPACGQGPSPIRDLVRAASRIPLGMADCESFPSDGEWERDALAAASALDVPALVSTLSEDELVVAQNSALHIALCSRAELRHLTARIVHELASDRTFATPSYHGTPELQSLFGSELVPRGSEQVPLVHEVAYSFTRFFLVLEAGREYLNVGFLVAVDRKWQPHVTSIVGSVESRSPGAGHPERACVLFLDPDQYRCRQNVPLVELQEALPPGSNLFWLAGSQGGIGCARCHYSGPFLTRTIDRRDIQDEMEERRTTFLSKSAQNLNSLCRDELLCSATGSGTPP